TIEACRQVWTPEREPIDAFLSQRAGRKRAQPPEARWRDAGRRIASVELNLTMLALAGCEKQAEGARLRYACTEPGKSTAAISFVDRDVRDKQGTLEALSKELLDEPTRAMHQASDPWVRLSMGT